MASLELAPAIKSYLTYCQKTRRLSRHTCNAYKSDLAIFQLLASTEIVDPKIILGALRKIIENPEHKAATIVRRVIAIHGFLNWWNGSLAQEVFSQLKFKMKTPKALPRTIPRRDLGLLFDGAQRSSSSLVGPHLHLILVLLASTGLRISELCSLRLLDIDLEKGELQVFGKGSKERIVVIANTTVRVTLGMYIEKHRDMAHPTAPLFCNKWGRPITPKWVGARLKLVAEISGVRRKITPHMFRHTAATLLIEGGVDIRFVQRLLGHSNISTTEIYTHVSDQALRSALERADVMQRFVELSAA